MDLRIWKKYFEAARRQQGETQIKVLQVTQELNSRKNISTSKKLLLN
jgi:hypothetical protein